MPSFPKKKKKEKEKKKLQRRQQRVERISRSQIGADKILSVKRKEEIKTEISWHQHAKNKWKEFFDFFHSKAFAIQYDR